MPYKPRRAKLPHCKYFPAFAILSCFKSAFLNLCNPGVVRGSNSNFQAWFWYNGTARSVVGLAAFHSSRSVGLRRLCNVGGVSRHELLFWQLPFTVLFP